MKLGQHFLKDEKILSKIAEFLDLNKEDKVLEIGAGPGNLTKYLMRGEVVYAIEIDKKFENKLKDMGENVKVIIGDALKLNWPKVNKICGNIPFKISSPLTEKILRYLNKFGGKAVVMYQKEFAQRVVANPGSKNYSHISMLCDYFSKRKILLFVSKNCFRPIPKVDAAVVEFIPRKVKINEEFLKWSKFVFTQKNKKLKNVINVDSSEYRDKRVRELGWKELFEVYKIENKI